jgi:hypothetical protein
MNVVKRYQHNGLNAKINPMLRGERPHNKQYSAKIEHLSVPRVIRLQLNSNNESSNFEN